MTSRSIPARLLVLLLAVCRASVDGSNSITCTTSGKVTEGHLATVTCNYNQNVENNKQDFYIYQNKKDGGEAVIVAICAWEGAGISCDLKSGFKVHVHAHTVTLNVTSAQHYHAGKYSCSTLPPEQGTQIEECSLSVQEKPLTDKMSIFCNKDGGQASVMCVFPENLDATTVTLERHDLLKSTEPVEVMRCNKRKDECSSALPGYETVVKTEADNFRTFRVNIPSYAADKSGLYVCKADTESTPYDMCTLKPDEVAASLEPEEEVLLELVVPLYLILACLILLLVIVLAILIKRCRENRRKGAASPGVPLLNGKPQCPPSQTIGATGFIKLHGVSKQRQ